MEGRSSSQTKARLIVLAVFVIGFAAGALSMNLYERMTASGERPKKNGKPEDHIVKKMDEKLNLTQDQEGQIREILSNTFEQYRVLKDEMRSRTKDFDGRFDAVRQQGRERIRAVLTAEQLLEYEKMIEEQDRRREEEKRKREEERHNK